MKIGLQMKNVAKLWNSHLKLLLDPGPLHEGSDPLLPQEIPLG